MKKRNRINWRKLGKNTKRVVLGNPSEKRETGKTWTLFFIVVVIYILYVFLGSFL